jgi:hypothetical protein
MDAMRPDVEGLKSQIETWAEPEGNQQGRGNMVVLE